MLGTLTEQDPQNIALKLGDLLEVCFVNTSEQLWQFSIENDSSGCLIAKGDAVYKPEYNPKDYAGFVYCQNYEAICATTNQNADIVAANPTAINLVFENVHYTVSPVDGGITTGDPVTTITFKVTVD